MDNPTDQLVLALEDYQVRSESISRDVAADIQELEGVLAEQEDALHKELNLLLVQAI